MTNPRVVWCLRPLGGDADAESWGSDLGEVHFGGTGLKPRAVLYTLTCLAFVFASTLFAQRADRAIITGIVADPTGALIPGASVTILDEGTGLATELQSNEAGVFNSPSLVLGTYTVSVESAGFKTFRRSGIILIGGQIFRQDATLELGDVTETVEVVAASEMITTQQGDLTHTVDEKYYDDLPVVMGADIRLAESLLLLQPGYTPMAPNGDPMFKGSQFNSRINGGQTMATENFFDGAAFGFAEGHQQTHESAPPIEGIREMKVINTTYSAQYGHSSGGFIEYTSKSGTNQLHGSLYEYFSNEALNASGFFGTFRPKDRKNNYGGSIGGPVVVPKVYDGRNRTFFFLNWDIYDFRSGTLPSYSNTTPIDAFKRGDFGELLTGAQAGTDILGRAIMDGGIFDPASTQTVEGVPVRDPFPNNVIPASHPMRSTAAQMITDKMVQPDRPGTAFNVHGGSGDQTWAFDIQTVLFRVDHAFTDNFRSTTSYFENDRPSTRRCGGVGGCDVVSTTDFEKNTDYIGQGFNQTIATHHLHQQFDYIITNNIVNHTTLAYDRWYMGGQALSAGTGWPERLWGPDRGGIIESGTGVPEINFSGNTPYSGLGRAWGGRQGGPGFNTNNRYQFSNDLTWIKGKNTIKMGIEFRHHQYPFRQWGANPGGQFSFSRLQTGGYDAAGNNVPSTGDPYASFILGQTHSGRFEIPAEPTFYERYIAPWVNVESKVTNALTLTLGLRWDYQTARIEARDMYSTFDLNAPNPGAGGRLGAQVFAGTGPNRTGSRRFQSPPRDAWGPRFGFAYRMDDKTVVRGGYGVYYSGVSNSQFTGLPTLGFTNFPTANNTNNGLTATYHWDDGIPRHLIRREETVDPTISLGQNAITVAEDDLTLPRYQNWSLTVQRQLSDNMVLDVSYIANRGTRLTNHPTSMGVLSNMNDPSILSRGAAVLNAPIGSAVAQGAGIGSPYPGFSGSVAQALRPFPQIQSIRWRSVPTGMSSYHSFQIKLDKRFANGLQFRTSYTRAKLLGNGAESGQGSDGRGSRRQIPTEPHVKTLSSDDVPNSAFIAWTYELPFMRNKKAGAARLVGGWSLSGILRYDGGRPINVAMANDLGGLLFNAQKRPNRVSGAEGNTNISGFDPNEHRFLSRDAWTDPGPLNFGDAPINDGTVRGFANISEDLSIFKDIWLTETLKARFETNLGNIFNRTVFCAPNSNWSAGAFGLVSRQCNIPRSIQFALRLDF